MNRPTLGIRDGRGSEGCWLRKQLAQRLEAKHVENLRRTELVVEVTERFAPKALWQRLATAEPKKDGNRAELNRSLKKCLDELGIKDVIDIWTRPRGKHMSGTTCTCIVIRNPFWDHVERDSLLWPRQAVLNNTDKLQEASNNGNVW